MTGPYVTFAAIFIVICVSVSLRSEASAQVRPIYDQGVLGLAQQLKRLNTSASALMIGAHPDDEDTALLAYLARGEKSRTAYLSLTRGDGGQNIIGPELGEALGVIRTEELLQARRLDGAEQFFTRAYDYGFSKTLAEAKQKWDEKVILCDVVKVIRSFRPYVVIAQFNGTASDGHGQHQFAGYISPLAVKAAADASQCTDAGSPWTVKKFYTRHRGQGEPSLRINTGQYDPLLGRSYFEIAMHARSQHRSQEQGVLELKGDQFSNLNLVSAADAGTKDEGLFANIAYERNDEGAIVDEDRALSKPTVLLPQLTRIFPASADDPRYPRVAEAVLGVSGIRIDVLADRETAVPGESFPVTVRLFTPNAAAIKVVDVTFNMPNVKAQEPTGSTPGPFRRETANFAGQYTVTVPPDAVATRPFWLENPRRGDLFQVNDLKLVIRPFQDPAAIAIISVEHGGKRFVVRRPVEYRFADDIRGEIRRELNIVPKIAVTPGKNLLIVSTGGDQVSHEVSVALTNYVSGPASGKVRLALPNGWTSSPVEADFATTGKGDRTSVRFTVKIPSGAVAGSYELRAEAVVNGETFSQTMQTIAYEHIQTHRIYRPATVDVKLIDLQTAPVKVGYIRGSGDRVAEAIEHLGIDVEDIDGGMLASGDLSRFNTIVVGIRAYQVRPDLVANNKRLLDFASNGGTVIVQYQLPATFPQQNLAPFPATLGPRVSDENAAVTIVDPTHPIFKFPNKIISADFDGWVQERNLYNFSTMDPKYVGLLESHDPGEAENRGGLVVADVGKGKYVYCSYSLFRQLPAGVPGAYRLLANLIGLSQAQRTGDKN